MRVSFLAAKLKSIVRSPHLWIILALFIVTTISHYHELLQNVPIIDQIATSVFFGAERHTEDRLIYILIIAYAGGVFGIKVGGACLLASFLVMLSRAIFISPSLAVALLETLLAAFIGVLLLTLIRASRRIRERQGGLEIAMATLSVSEEKYHELFQNASDAIWTHDLDGRMTVANKACEKMTGYTVDELLGREVTEFLSEDALALARNVKRRLLKGEPVDERYEQRIFRRDGTEAIMELATRLITQNGQPVAFHNIARDVTEERKMRDSMRFYLQKVLVAQEEERKRIARDLHDDTSQSLLLLTHRLDAIASDPKNKLSKPVQEKLNELHSLAVETLDSLRRYAQELRPAILDDMGLIASLEWIADNLIAENGINVDVQVDMREHALPHEAQLTLFRIAQEALVNIKRHAQASEVVIRLEAAAGKLTMVITDNGKGFKVPMPLSQLGSTKKLGLLGMQERAQLLSGSLNIQSELGKGTAITVEIPLER